jgi:hypothetical protein
MNCMPYVAKGNYLLRHLYTRVAAHGLYHRIFTTKGFDSPNERCQWILCGGLCNTYHIMECTGRILTLSHYAKDTNDQWLMMYNLYFVHSVFIKSSTIFFSVPFTYIDVDRSNFFLSIDVFCIFSLNMAHPF